MASEAICRPVSVSHSLTTGRNSCARPDACLPLSERSLVEMSSQAAVWTARARMAVRPLLMDSSSRRTSGCSAIGALGSRPMTCPWDALGGVRLGLLVGAVGDAEGLEAGAHARGAHHDEHRVQATVAITDQKAGGCIIFDGKGPGAMALTSSAGARSAAR
jgi:hypothetical protein